MDKRNPLTFHTVFKILETYYFLKNLNRNRFGPSTANEKGVAKNQDFVKAALTDWLFCIFWDITLPTRGSISDMPCSRGKDSS
jgi:hypothetical protein